MALLSDRLKNCGVKIEACVSGVDGVGSGVVYLTPNNCEYNYIITAKHLFQEDSRTPFSANKISSIGIYYSDKGKFAKLQTLKKADVAKRIITFDADVAILIIDKNANVVFSPILVADELDDLDMDFFSWAAFSANHLELNKFDLKRHDTEVKRFKLQANLKAEYLSGMSGAGVFLGNKPVLYGVISRYPNEDFQNETIDCAQISMAEINLTLKSLDRVILDAHGSRQKRQIENEIVDIHQAYINEVCLDLELARKRLSTDIEDDWYHDPLKYIDLLNQDFLFVQLGSYLTGKKNYQAAKAERFYVPKKKYTLRQAMISPFTDRILYMAVVGSLAEKMDSAMIPNVYSARLHRYSDDHLIINGVEQWKKMKYKLAECANKKNEEGDYLYNCVIEIDLLNFYDNINKELLYEKVKRICQTNNDNKAADFLFDILKQFSDKAHGIPQNSDASALLASFYLNQVDNFMSHHAPEYFRFMDDIRIFCQDKYEARRILQLLESELRRCYLSVNSEKTDITTLSSQNDDQAAKIKSRLLYGQTFDFDINLIARLRKSENLAYKNQAFHLGIQLLTQTLADTDKNGSDESARKMNYALNTITALARKDIKLFGVETIKSISTAVELLKDKPWITPQVCMVLNLIPSDEFKQTFLEPVQAIVLNKKFNSYSFQTYQIWLLLAKHKIISSRLKKFAARKIEQNDQMNQPTVAAMVIYMCSVDIDYRRVILRKFREKFTREYFQNRSALISLRSFPMEIIGPANIDPTLSGAHEFTYKFKDRDLVFVQGFDEDGVSEGEDDAEFEQLYSL